jgi:hypothetical protein
MELKLAVPALSTRVLTEVELQSPKVAKWLENLPLLNVVETSRKLFSTLTVYNRIEIDTRERLALLELYRPTVRNVCAELLQQYVGLPLPLSDKHKSIAEQARQFQVEMAFGYKRIVQEQAMATAAAAGKPDAEELALPIQRAVRYLTGVHAMSYQSYSPCPTGTWEEIHALFRHAETLGAATVEVPDTLNDSIPHSSVAHAYKQALLLDLANPYHLPARQIERIHHYLDRYASLATLTPATAVFDPTCQFLIDLHGQNAGIVNTGDTALDDPARYRLLNTVELARMIHTQWTGLQRGEIPPPDGLEPEFFRDGAQELLFRLANAWGLHPRRTFRRTSGQDVTVDVVIGIDAINYWLNGGRRFAVSSSFVGPTPQRTTLGLHEPKVTHDTTPEHDFSTWHVLDEGAGGQALVKKGLITTRVRVGDIVATRRSSNGGSWEVGIIRWVRSASSSHAEIGTQRIAPQAEACVVKTFNERNEESDFLPALLLPEVNALKMPPSLVTHRGVFKPQREIYMDSGYRLYKLVLTEPVDVTAAYERFQFEVLNA